MPDQEQKAAVALDWWVRCYLRKYLELAGLDECVEDLAGLKQIQSLDGASSIREGLPYLERIVTEKCDEIASEMGLPLIDTLNNRVIEALNNTEQGLNNLHDVKFSVERVRNLVQRLASIICVDPKQAKRLGDTAKELEGKLEEQLSGKSAA